MPNSDDVDRSQQVICGYSDDCWIYSVWYKVIIATLIVEAFSKKSEIDIMCQYIYRCSLYLLYMRKLVALMLLWFWCQVLIEWILLYISHLCLYDLYVENWVLSTRTYLFLTLKAWSAKTFIHLRSCWILYRIILVGSLQVKWAIVQHFSPTGGPRHLPPKFQQSGTEYHLYRLPLNVLTSVLCLGSFAL